MSAGTPLRLFQGFGIELEYMVVDAASLSIAPIADQIMHEVTGEYSDYESEKTAWSSSGPPPTMPAKAPSRSRGCARAATRSFIGG